MGKSSAYNTFLKSTNIDYEKWHDGIPYDLEAYAQMTSSERDEVAGEMLVKDELDWRDMQVLAAHGKRESIDRLRHELAVGPVKSRAWALWTLIDHGHTPGSVPDTQLAHVLDAIDSTDDVMPALDLARAHAGPISKLSLMRGLLERPRVAFFYAEVLLQVCGLAGADAAFDPRFRPLLLRLLPGPQPDREKAIAEVCKLLDINPAEIPEAGSGIDRTWAEKKWDRR